MQNIFSRKAVSFALALTMTAVSVLGAPITARAAGTDIETGFMPDADRPENNVEYTEATPSDANEEAPEEAAPSDAKEEAPEEATPSDAKEPEIMLLQGIPEPVAKIIGGSGYTSVQEAVENAVSGNTVQLLADAEGGITVLASQSITLDLNGYILSGPEAGGCVIENYGTLTVIDSRKTAPHYFDYDTDGSLNLNPTATEGVAPDKIEEIPAVVKLSGGCITGGYEGDSNGGAILNRSDSFLTVTGCNIVGNTAVSGGGIYIALGSTAALTDTVFFANTATGEGGALYLASANTGDPAVPMVGQAKLERVLLTGNRAKNGGAAAIYNFSCLLMKDCRVTANSADRQGGGIYKPSAGDSGVKCILLNTEVTGNTAGEKGGGIYFARFAGCFAAGTLITMADGSVREIGDITEGDLVKTFDHKTGSVSAAGVYYAYKGEAPAVPFTLTFDDGRSLSIADCHDLLEKESRKYVTLTEANAETFVGSSFYGEDGKWHTLLSVAKESAPCDYYSIYTAVSQNCFANGLLSVPDDVDYMLSLYELDENLKADEEQLASDIAEFGLYSFEDAKTLRNVSRDWFDAAGAQYLNIVIGKGLLTLEEAAALFDSVDGVGTEEAEEAEGDCFARAGSEVKTFLSAALNFLGGLFVIPAYAGELTSTVPAMSDVKENVLTIGKGTKITGNTAETDDPVTDNVYLAPSSTGDMLIDLTGDSHEGICVGITTQVKPDAEKPAVPFTTSGNHMSKADEAFFFSDKEDYADRFSSEKNRMELVVVTRCYIDANKNGQQDSDEIGCKNVQAAVTEAGTTGQTVIRMTDDSEENVEIATGQDIVLDLNGHVLSAPEAGGSVIDNRGKLTVTDSDPTVPHYFDYSDTAAWTWNPDATAGDTLDEITGSTTSVKLFGGCITGGTGHYTSSYFGGGGIYDYGTGLVLHAGNIVGNTADMGGGILSYHLTMDGGTVIGNAASAQGGGIFGGSNATLNIRAGIVSHNRAATYGGGICSMLNLNLSGGSVSHNRAASGGGICNMYSLVLSDVSITCNEADWGGGVYNRNGTTAILSGNILIAGNKATNEGGGVYNTVTMTFPWTMPGTTFEMTGGKITGNAAPLGGGVTFGESITLGGTADITGNTHLDDAIADDLYLPSGKTVTISTAAVPVAKDPADSSKAYMLVGIRTEAEPEEGSPVAVSGTNSADYHGSFIADDTSYGIQNGTGNVVMIYLGLPMTFIAGIPDQIHTGSAIEPEVTVKSGETVLTKDTDYTVSYQNNVNVGRAAVTIVGQGIYSGTKTAQFNIVQPQPEPKKDGTGNSEGTTILLMPEAGGACWAHVTGSGSDDWYYIRSDGTKATGWLLDTDGSWYYLDKTDGKNPGAMQTGWMTDRDDGYRYYLDPKTGKMLTGWAVIDGKKYYFNENVSSASGWTQNANGDWVYSRQSVIPLGALTKE